MKGLASQYTYRAISFNKRKVEKKNNSLYALLWYIKTQPEDIIYS